MKKNNLFISVLIFTFISLKLFPQTVILSENFNGSSLPVGWSVKTNASDGGWLVGSSNSMSTVTFPIPNNGTNVIATSDSKCNCNKVNDRLLLPKLNLSNHSGVFMSFDKFFFKSSNQGIYESAVILTSTDSINWVIADSIKDNTMSGFEKQTVNLSNIAGHSTAWIAFKYSDGGGWLYGAAFDNVVVYAPVPGLNLNLLNAGLGKKDPRPVFTIFDKYITGMPLRFQATITNSGTVPISSFDLSWNTGTNTNVVHVTGINIPPLGTYSLIDTINPYITLAGSHNINVLIQNINNGSIDIDLTNNHFSFNITGLTPNPDKNFLAEEATGSWCGFCIRGIVFMEYMRKTYPERFFGVAVHEGDAMKLSNYSLSSSMPNFQGYPSIAVNRGSIVDPLDIEAAYIEELTEAPPVIIKVDASMDVISKLLTITVTGNFTQSLNGDYRFNAIITEDSVHVVSSAYDQNNYYSNNVIGLMGGYESLPDPIASSNMYYDFVARYIAGSWAGTAGSLPSSINSGSSYSKTYTYTVPGNWDISKIKVIGLVLSQATGKVQNVNSSKVSLTTGIAVNDDIIQKFTVDPNPFENTANLKIETKRESNYKIRLMDLLGNEICQISNNVLSEGEHVFTISQNQIPRGVYFVEISNEMGRFIRKIVKQ